MLETLLERYHSKMPQDEDREKLHIFFFPVIPLFSAFIAF